MFFFVHYVLRVTLRMGFWIARSITKDQQDAALELVEAADNGLYGNDSTHVTKLTCLVQVRG